MKLVGESVYLTPAEEAILQITSPVPANVAFGFSAGLLQRSEQLSDRIQDELRNRAETYNESRWQTAKLVGKAISRHEFGLARHAIVPAIKQAINPDSHAFERSIDAISCEASEYANLGNALKRAQNEANILAASNDMLQGIDDYLITSAMDGDEN